MKNIGSKKPQYRKWISGMPRRSKGPSLLYRQQLVDIWILNDYASFGILPERQGPKEQSVQATKPKPTSFRQGLSRNPDFEALYIADSGQKHAGMTIEGSRFINPIDNLLSIF
jgi:hypothetical protein